MTSCYILILKNSQKSLYNKPNLTEEKTFFNIRKLSASLNVSIVLNIV